MGTVRLGILGYGNLGKGVELAVRQNDDIELVAVYSRRDPASVAVATENLPVKPEADKTWRMSLYRTETCAYNERKSQGGN